MHKNHLRNKIYLNVKFDIYFKHVGFVLRFERHRGNDRRFGI